MGVAEEGVLKRRPRTWRYVGSAGQRRRTLRPVWTFLARLRALPKATRSRHGAAPRTPASALKEALIWIASYLVAGAFLLLLAKQALALALLLFLFLAGLVWWRWSR